MATAAQKYQREALRAYLRQYNNAKQRKHDLEHRLHEVMAELNNPPISGQARSEPRSKGKPAAGAASVAFKIDDIEQRIKDQQAEMARTLNNVLDILDLLPEASTTRSILEQRYIDGKKWDAISGHAYLTRSRCAELETEALDQLLSFKKVVALLYQIDPEVFPSAT
jgi:hypothetical protein